MLTATEALWQRFREHTATEADCLAIIQEERAAPNPCPDLLGWLVPIHWQLSHMDRIDGREPVMADALAVFTMLADEEDI